MANILGMMKQAQQLQSKMQEMQAGLEAMEVVGTSGGGMLSVTLNGKGVMRSVSIDPSLVDAEEREILEDLIVAAHNDAKTRLETAMAEKMKELTGGLELPPGLNLGL